MTAHEFAVTVGMDALGLAIGRAPKNHDVETILRWLRAMADQIAKKRPEPSNG